VGGFVFVGFITGGMVGTDFVFGDGATLSGVINGGTSGNNMLDSSLYISTEYIVINGANAGGGTVGVFTNIQTVIGGSGSFNDFVFVDGGSLDGGLNGGSGFNEILDYSSGWSSNVIADLQIGAASGIAGLAAGAVVNIQSVAGGNGGGSGFYNLLIGNGGGNGGNLQGGTGRRNILVAGGSANTLTGGDGEDLIIAGGTAYDTEATLGNWQAVATWWVSSDPFATRVANLLSGNGVPILDPTPTTGNVFGNGGGNTLSASGALAAIFTDGADTLSGFDSNSQTITITP
jgi:hypothetical protein